MIRDDVAKDQHVVEPWEMVKEEPWGREGLLGGRAAIETPWPLSEQIGSEVSDIVLWDAVSAC